MKSAPFAGILNVGGGPARRAQTSETRREAAVRARTPFVLAAPYVLVVEPAEQLWESVRVFFELDDGSLPEVVVSGLAPQEVQFVFDFLKGHAANGTLVGQTTWVPARGGADVLVLELQSPGLAAAEGRLPALHLVFRGVSFSGVRLPDLGAYFEVDAVAIDYFQGAQWGPVTIGAFADLLGAIAESCPEAVFDPYDEVQSERPPNLEFRGALAQYWAAGPARLAECGLAPEPELIRAENGNRPFAAGVSDVGSGW